MSGEATQGGSGGPAPEDLLAAARLRRPHGLRGEIHAEVFAPAILDVEREFVGRAFWLRRGARLEGRAVLLAAHPFQDHYRFHLEGFDDRTAAESLAGVELCLPRAELPPLPEGWHWEADLIGLEVVDAKRGSIGVIAGLDAAASQPSLLVRKPSGVEFTVPWAKALVPAIDLQARQARVDLPLDYPGLD